MKKASFTEGEDYSTMSAFDLAKAGWHIGVSEFGDNWMFAFREPVKGSPRIERREVAKGSNFRLDHFGKSYFPASVREMSDAGWKFHVKCRGGNQGAIATVIFTSPNGKLTTERQIPFAMIPRPELKQVKKANSTCRIGKTARERAAKRERRQERA